MMLVMPPVVTLHEARDTLRMLKQVLQREVKACKDQLVTMDASSLVRFDSAALVVLVECQRLALAWGRGFAVRNAPTKLLELARLYGVDTLLMPPDPQSAQ